MTTVRDAGTGDARLVRLAADLASAAAAADHIDAHRAELLDVLTRYESFEAATDEIDRSVDTLRNLHREVPGLRTARAGRTAVFLPVNLPLYSLVLFAAVPSLAADSVTVRGPAATAGWHAQVLAVSGLGRYFPRLELVHTPPDAYMVHASRAEEFLARLLATLAALPAGRVLRRLRGGPATRCPRRGRAGGGGGSPRRGRDPGLPR
ncbi:hypothetical protein [Streptomyces erythrochromogenes]|uniref:hypothetical protein n=1 Tax=Streptomyces erythrochromogenes TaxID=285574 RepID=UPI0036BD6691